MGQIAELKTKYETIERCGRIHVIKNGVESSAFVKKSREGWYMHHYAIATVISSADEGITRIVNAMDTWRTVPQAAARLAELDGTGEPPSMQTMYRWLRAGRFPGAVKVQAVGAGGSWRLPGAALLEFRKGDEKR